jgi:hypothetical protein
MIVSSGELSFVHEPAGYSMFRRLCRLITGRREFYLILPGDLPEQIRVG